MSKFDIWDYFNRVINTVDMKKSECKLCNNVLNHTSTSFNLKAHLQKQHRHEIPNIPVLRRPVIKTDKREGNSGRRYISRMWKYFTKANEITKYASCNLCGREFSYKGSTSNLKTHLLRAHAAEYEVCEETEIASESPKSIHTDPDAQYFGSDDDDSDYVVPVSEVNKLFTKDRNGRASCDMCNATVPMTQSCLTAHIKEVHPKILKPSNDESDVEESEPNNTYQEVVYLYDSDSKSTKKEVAPVRPKKLETSTPVIQKEREREREKEKEKKERDKTDGIDRRKRRRMSMFVEEETPAKENGEGDEEIEKFGKYVVCLMKTIPKELCTQLQMDMINLIMTAKIKYMAKPMETSDSNAQAEFVVMNEGKVQHMQIADDGAEKTTETDANEQTYEEVVYLQDSDTKTLKEIRLKKLDGPDKKHESEHRKRRLMTTQDEKGVDDDEIEKFGKYVTCLMKPLPNELCTQLQMDIINTIMRGKIKFMSKPTPVPQTNVIIEKVGTDYQPSLVMTVANEHMPFLEANTVVATQA
ncbi:uncharacterized protein [Epargyreus clarus]|uniref:uncharacterized protein isoform X4 n=1 Tax=Epargyreus clarus TaxID=520877 RepID=UPI003C2F6CF8